MSSTEETRPPSDYPLIEDLGDEEGEEEEEEEDEDEDEDEEFEDALADLGHLAMDDNLPDPGLPTFDKPVIDPKSTAQHSSSIIFDPRVSTGLDYGNSPMSESSDTSETEIRGSLPAADSGYISNSNAHTESSEGSLPGQSEFVFNSQNSSYEEQRLKTEGRSTNRSKSNARDHIGASSVSELPSTSTNDASAAASAQMNDVPSTSRDSEPSCSAGMDDFTCDLPSDDVTGDCDEGDDVTPSGLEVDEEEEEVRRRETQWTEEEKEERKLEANNLKTMGNQAFKLGDFDKAEDLYTQALSVCPTCFANDRSIMYSNRSACKLRKEEDTPCLVDCTRALKLNPDYVKCLLRRAEIYERQEKLDESLQDYKHVYELDRSILAAAAAIMRLEQKINERNEKMKEEMMGQLKNLGNMILKPFGFSTDNFQLNQDPNSGGYSINFQR